MGHVSHYINYQEQVRVSLGVRISTKMEDKVRQFVEHYILKSQVRLYKPVTQNNSLHLTEEVTQLLERPENMNFTIKGKYLNLNKIKLTWKKNIDRSYDYTSKVSTSKNNFEVMEWLASHM